MAVRWLLAVALVGCGAPHPALPDASQQVPDGASVADARADADGSVDSPGCSVAGVAGAIDPSFGDHGVVTFFGLTPTSIASGGAVAIDPNDRIVITGYTTSSIRS